MRTSIFVLDSLEESDLEHFAAAGGELEQALLLAGGDVHEGDAGDEVLMPFTDRRGIENVLGGGSSRGLPGHVCRRSTAPREAGERADFAAVTAGLVELESEPCPELQSHHWPR